MRCSSYCNAQEYVINQNTLNRLKKQGLQPEIIEKVLHYTVKSDDNQNEEGVEVFLFPFGSIIIWGANEKQEEQILRNIKFAKNKSLNQTHYEFINYAYNESENRTYINEEKNTIILGDKSKLVKLSVSHALAQSVKLEELEEFVVDLLKQAKPIQKELAKTGRVSMSKSQLSKELGKLFNARYSINLHSDILDIPEFFWRRPSFEPIYHNTVEFQDIILRQGILNNHLSLIHDLYGMLSDDLDQRHATRLEIIIVLLIAIEVIFTLIDHKVLSYIVDLFS